jgi:CRISPR-associated protein Cmr2
LSGFAENVLTIVREHEGVCIYAGGDDVMALLPLHFAVQCAQTLAQSFHEALHSFQDEQGNSPTLSAGLAIVHHLHPLWDALDLARAAEKRAKSGKKNALAITVQKRGGPPCEIGGQWNAFDLRLEDLITFCQQNIIPSGMAYELKDLALRLDQSLLAQTTSKKEAQSNSSPGYVQYAALRIFKRKLDEARSGGTRSKKELADIIERLKRMIGLPSASRDPVQTGQLADKPVPSLNMVQVGQLADELVVARLFAHARELAGIGSEGANR